MLWFGDDDSVSLLSSCGESEVVEGAGLLEQEGTGFLQILGAVAHGVC